MPEIKQNFSAGKMNKDLDERLLPKGEYRHAENIQVSTSEESDVGALENILSNTKLSDGFVLDNSVCVGKYADEKNNSLYWLVTGNSVAGAGLENSTFEDPDAFVNYTQEEWELNPYSTNWVENDKWFIIADGTGLTYQQNVTNPQTDHGITIVNGVVTRGANNGTNASLRQLVDIVEGVEYTVSYRRKYISHTVNNGGTNFYFDYGSGNTSLASSTEKSGNFVTVTDTFVAEKTDTIQLRIYFDKDVRAQIDDVTITTTQQGSKILRYMSSTNTIEPVLVDLDNSVLKFDRNKIITGINVIDNLLFFTDNQNEPKKINIDRCIQGTQDINTHTKLIVPERDIDLASDIDIREEHITVIKKSPKTKLTLDVTVDTIVTADIVADFMSIPSVYGGGLAQVGDTVIVPDTYSANYGSSFGITNFFGDTNFDIGDELFILNSVPGQTSATDLPEIYDIKVKVVSRLDGLSIDAVPGYTGPSNYPANTYGFKILEVKQAFSETVQNYFSSQWFAHKKADTTEFFEKQFARFSYRYKYQDGEYSTFAPFSDVAFFPANFDYETKKAYNLGMENQLKTLVLRDFITADILEDVVQIDLLYKESNSPNVYIVDKVKFKDLKDVPLQVDPTTTILQNNWEANKYRVVSDTIYSVLPANQLLRPYDNVPRKALAQEVTGNRIVYGNYIQNYDLNEKPIVDATYVPRSGVTLSESIPQKSLKSVRNYQVGIVYLDEYGRQTPVFSSSRSSFKIPKGQALSSNAIQFKAATPAPDWASSYKVYVKETSNEYYNLAMDRVYKAKDGNLWLSFPSSERNKVDEETFLILKKQLDANTQVQDNLKYKIIAIENEAPIEVKANNIFIAESNGTGDIENLFSGDTPQVGSLDFQIDESTFKADGGPSIDNITNTLSVKFKDTSENVTSGFYEVASVEFVSPHYNIKLRTKIKEIDSWIYKDFYNTTTFLASDLNDNLTLRVYQDERREQPEFDGKFFVKILNDASTEQYVLKGAYTGQEYSAVAYVDAFYIADRGADYTSDPFDVQSSSDYSTWRWDSDERANWSSDFLQFNVGNIGSEWFIDQAYYADIHPADNDLYNSSQVAAPGFGKGIYKDSDDQWFMELSFSQILPDAEYKFRSNSLIFPEQSSSSYNPLTLDLNTKSLQEAKLFAVGSVINSEHVDQADIVRNLTKNKIFRFVGDNLNSKYIISGEVIKEKRYNYKPFKDVYDLYQAFLAIYTANPGSFTTSVIESQAPFQNLEADWDAFSEAINRRITYKIPFKLYSDTPDLNSDGTPNYAQADPIENSEFTDATTSNTHEFIDQDYGAWNNNPSGIQFLERSEREDDQLTSNNPAIWETEPKENIDLDIYYEASECYDISLHGTTQELEWFNCYSFGNGVESDRLRDDFNQVRIDKGAIASSTVDFVYEEEHRKSGLIHSGIYNSTSGVNNLNQFIQAEGITKDINPTYGSIQKLFSRNTDIITFCEDKVVKVLANKDALFNADGNPQLIATENVLGQTIPFIGDYGISNNPESFAKESYRAYFTDKSRGKVLRLSRDGITPVSDYGMSKFFKDNLKNQDKLIGSYDQKKSEYNLTLKNNTVSYDEKVRGWSSFKSFVADQGVSLTNSYYTFKNGHLYKHHDDVISDFNTEVTYNNFYGTQYESKISTILNDAPDAVKSFKTVVYEGTQSAVVNNLNDENYYNLASKEGWSLENIRTDQEQGFIPEFINKENKWFNNIKGKLINDKKDLDIKSFSFQGIGKPSLVEFLDIPPTMDIFVEVFMLPKLSHWFVTNNSNQTVLKRGLTGSTNMFDDPNEPNGSNLNPNVIREQIFGGNVYRQGETVNETVQFKIRPGIDISLPAPYPPVPIQASDFKARHIAPPGPDGERSRVFDSAGAVLQHIDISDDAGGAVEDLGVVQSTIRNEASPLTSIPGPGYIGSSFSPISANVSFVDTDVPLSNDNHVLVNVPIKFTVPVDPDAKTIRIELYLEYQTSNI